MTRPDCTAGALHGAGGIGNRVFSVPRVSDISFAPTIRTLPFRLNDSYTIPSAAIQPDQLTPVSWEPYSQLEQVLDHLLSRPEQ